MTGDAAGPPGRGESRALPGWPRRGWHRRGWRLGAGCLLLAGTLSGCAGAGGGAQPPAWLRTDPLPPNMPRYAPPADSFRA